MVAWRAQHGPKGQQISVDAVCTVRTGPHTVWRVTGLPLPAALVIRVGRRRLLVWSVLLLLVLLEAGVLAVWGCGPLPRLASTVILAWAPAGHSLWST